MTRFLFEKLYISSSGEARNIKFAHQINIIERVPLGTLPQVVVMPLAHNLSKVTDKLLLSNLGSKSSSMIKVNRSLLHWG